MNNIEKLFNTVEIDDLMKRLYLDEAKDKVIQVMYEALNEISKRNTLSDNKHWSYQNAWELVLKEAEEALEQCDQLAKEVLEEE